MERQSHKEIYKTGIYRMNMRINNIGNAQRIICPIFSHVGEIENDAV